MTWFNMQQVRNGRRVDDALELEDEMITIKYCSSFFVLFVSLLQENKDQEYVVWVSHLLLILIVE